MSRRLAQSPDSTDTPHSLAPYKSSASKVGSSLSKHGRSRKNHKLYPTPDEAGSGYPYPHKHSKNSSYSGNNGSNKKETNHQPSKKRVKTKMERVKLAAKIALAVILIVSGGLCFDILRKTLMNHLEMESVWNMHPQPKVVTADDILIASSSESCNELIKSHVVNHNVKMKLPTIAVIMNLCLANAEPHNSGLAAHALSVYVDAKRKRCLQTQGHYRIQSDLSNTVHAVRHEYKNHLQGIHSIALPGFVSNLLGSTRFQYYNETDILNLNTAVQTLGMTLNNKQLPVSASMAGSVAHSGLDAAFTFMPTFAFSNNDNVMVQKGELFAARQAALIQLVQEQIEEMMNNRTHPYQAAVQKINDQLSQIISIGMFTTGHESSNNNEHYMGLTEEEIDVKRGKRTKINGYTVCSANLPTSSSFVVDGLKRHSSSERFKKHIDKSNPMKILQNIDFYKELFDTVNHTTGLFKDISKIKGFAVDDKYDTTSLQILRKIHEREKKKENEEKKRTKKKIMKGETESYGSNFFVIIDVKAQQAIASVASLGSSLGSLVSDDSKSHIYNNLLAHIGADLEHVGPVVHPLQPIIAMKDGKIALAMAGCGGALTRSMDIARTIATAALRLIFEIPIEKAVTVPLIFPSRGTAEYTSGFPWPELAEMSEHLKKRYPQLEKRKRRADSGKAWRRLDRAVVASSDGKTAKGLFHDDGMEEMLPAAL